MKIETIILSALSVLILIWILVSIICIPFVFSLKDTVKIQCMNGIQIVKISNDRRGIIKIIDNDSNYISCKNIE